MEDKKQQTKDTYNDNAQAFADKFDNLGVRVRDIEETFILIKKENPRVLEIGCGNGRDATEIIRRTSDYLGIDVSEKLIELARVKVPGGRFKVVDIESFVFPRGFDIIFAFASLIHVPKEAFKEILSVSYHALNPDGVFRISLKYAKQYGEVTQKDELGVRTSYGYSKEDIEEISGQFLIIKNELEEFKDQVKLEVLLQKNAK
jgi:SAM-dependent methyltransferase